MQNVSAYVRRIEDKIGLSSSAVEGLEQITRRQADSKKWHAETGKKLRERINGHRADIRYKAATPVGIHFNKLRHELRISSLKKKKTKQQGSNISQGQGEDVDQTHFKLAFTHLHEYQHGYVIPLAVTLPQLHSFSRP